METIEHQEWRSRQHVSVGAILKSTLTCGIIFFVMSGGSPWSTSGTMDAVMGRELQISFMGLLFGHFAVALIYTTIIGLAIYRYATPVAVAAGVAVGLVLYLANIAFFQMLAIPAPDKEFVTFFVHVVYSLFAALLYKAFAFPKIEDSEFVS